MIGEVDRRQESTCPGRIYQRGRKEKFEEETPYYNPWRTEGVVRSEDGRHSFGKRAETGRGHTREKGKREDCRG